MPQPHSEKDTFTATLLQTSTSYVYALVLEQLQITIPHFCKCFWTNNIDHRRRRPLSLFFLRRSSQHERGRPQGRARVPARLPGVPAWAVPLPAKPHAPGVSAWSQQWENGVMIWTHILMTS